MAKFSALLSLLVVALVAVSTTGFAPQPVFGKFEMSKMRVKSTISVTLGKLEHCTTMLFLLVPIIQ
jgi:hypothetical protein